MTGPGGLSIVHIPCPELSIVHIGGSLARP